MTAALGSSGDGGGSGGGGGGGGGASPRATVVKASVVPDTLPKLKQIHTKRGIPRPLLVRGDARPRMSGAS
jgi:hypothetical protein